MTLPVARGTVILYPKSGEDSILPRPGNRVIHSHGVEEGEVEDVLTNPGEDRPGREGSRVAIGQTEAGRYLRVVYVRDPEPDSLFVITAYDLSRKAAFAYRRRRRKKRK
ncbi:MAG TPA: DUF4258 domain-containing protein [Blastocatellia bacterium]|nr:DUF4258 domain-containing protein [Blastocatellia bacterium]